MNDFGRIEQEDVLDAGNPPFDDLQLGDFEFDFFDGDGVLISGVCAPNENSPDQENLLGKIEQFLLSDFDGLVDSDQTPSVAAAAAAAAAAADAFFSDVFVDSPPPPPVDPGSGSSSTSEASNDHLSAQFPSAQACDTNQNDGTNQNDDSNDRVGKKRERQLRNRDAAVRSRERKKMYVRDLELKSRYFEAECKRLGMMLQCSLAENHALKFSLQNSGAAFAASATKQESAVLLLESLLLGSLLWFLGIKGLFILTLFLLLLLPILKEAVPPQEDLVGGKSRESPVPRKILNNIFGASLYRFTMMNKKWRGSRTRMKTTRALSVFKSLFMSIDLGSLCSGLVGGLVR